MKEDSPQRRREHRMADDVLRTRRMRRDFILLCARSVLSVSLR